MTARKVMHFVAEYAIFAALAGLFVFLSISKSGVFLTEANLTNILRQNSHTVILATGMTLVILTAGIDLSVGAIVALAGVLCADVLTKGHGIAAGLGAGVALGALAGLVSGLFVTRVKIPPFVATLAMMLVVRGAAFKYTDARTIAIPESVLAGFSRLSNGITPVLIMAGVIVAAWLVLTRTAFGRHVYAVGGNPEAARLAGVRVKRVLLMVYVACGLLAGLAGVIVASRIGSGYPRAGELYELDAIAATVVGGTSLFGGRGSIWGTLAGAFFIGILNNGLNLHQVGQYDQMILKGVVLLGATSLDLWRGKDQE
ncbi:MAG: ABC transporter permease [Planctomycetota bacterium]|jgi:ribose/xylose/arabinose/galactoside ABC-type transport system permease subunit